VAWFERLKTANSVLALEVPEEEGYINERREKKT